MPIYGASRLGVYMKASNAKSYQLTDHLGNVRAVAQRVVGSSVVTTLSYADYYPFGEQLQGRSSSSNYRYTYQGQEKDGETGMEAFQLRMWDGRLGRWLSPDPYKEFYSPYVGMGNNPINLTDPDGGCTTCPNNAQKGDIYNDINGFGEVRFDGTDWISNDGSIAMNDVVIGANKMTPFDVGVEWITEEGERHRNFYAGDTFTEMLKTHNHVQQTQDIIARKAKSYQDIIIIVWPV